MSPRTASRWVRTCLAVAAVTFLIDLDCARAQVAAGQPSSVGPASGAQPATRLAIAAATAADCATTHAAGASRFCIRAAADGFGAEAPAQHIPGVLTLKDAIQRALEHNLTILGLTHAVSQARGQQRVARSRLMPTVTGEFSVFEQRLNLAAMGVQFDIPVPGFVLENAAGPFNVLDVRARLSQTLVDVAAKQNHRATAEAVRASELSVDDVQDLIAAGVGRAYLEGLAARARVEAIRAQVDTATAIHEKAVQQQASGLATPLDVNRAQVQTLTARQRLAALEAAFAKQKIDLTRIAGFPPTDQYDLDRSVPFSPAPSVTVEEAVKEAMDRRSDLKAVEAQVRAAELALSAARAERLPSVALVADYGANRAAGRGVVNTYLVAGVVRLSLWEGGRIGGQVEQAMSVLSRRKAERDDLRAQIEADIRKAYVDLHAAETGVKVAELNVQITRETLGLTRQRFDAGVSDNIAVVQSQESLATVELDYINSVLAHNLAKLELARSLGRVAENIDRFLQLPQGSR